MKFFLTACSCRWFFYVFQSFLCWYIFGVLVVILQDKIFWNSARKNCADADSCKAAGVMRRARLADLLHKQTVSVLRGGTYVL